MVGLDNGCWERDDVRIAMPPPDLGGLVEYIWEQACWANAHEWRIVPDVSPHLIATISHGRGGLNLRAVLVGPRSRVAVTNVNNRLVTVGIRLTPGTIPALVGASAHEFMDRAIPFEDVFASPVLGNLELAVDSPPALLASGMVQIVRRAAGASLPGPLPAALKRVCNVRDMTQVLNAPERTVRDRALREIGLPPKRALRILRLHRALTIARKRDLSWATVACTAGYADQAHLTRECRALLGDTPSQWLARGSADSFKTAAAARL